MATATLPSLAAAFIYCLSLVDGSFDVRTSLSGYYQLDIDGHEFIRSDISFIYANDKFYQTDQTLVLRDTNRDVLHDDFGSWDIIRYTYYADDIPIEFSIRTHESLPVAIFTQKYLVDVKINTDTSNFTISGFPNFEVPFYNKYGYLSFGGNWMGDDLKRSGEFQAGTAEIYDGYSGSGPLCLFDTSGNAIVISALNNFMTASSYFWQKKRYLQGSLHYGIGGEVKSVPANHEQQTVIYYSANGINSAFEDWGAFLQKWYKKQQPSTPDLTLTSLGYWIDHGSYYYKNPRIGHNVTYVYLVADIQTKYFNKIPIQYIELDDWWYERDDYGMLLWSADKAALPGGFSYIYGVLKVLTALNAGKWSPNNTYSVDNGGNYTFISSSTTAIPIEEEFWDEIFTKSKSMGMRMMVQDQLMEQMLSVDQLRSNLTLGRDWLVAMGKSAERHGIPIQYSSCWPSHALQTLEIPAVTQVKVSGKYMKQKDQWKIGVISILANALGLAPSKDTFWSTITEPGNIYNSTEPSPYLQSLMATLSMGPVGPGDGIPYVNNLAAAKWCCREDGVILKPSRPLTASDSQIMKMALNDSKIPTGELLSTVSRIGNLTFGIIVLVNVENIKLTPSLIFNKDFPQDQRIWMFSDPKRLYAFSDKVPLNVTNCTGKLDQLCIGYTSPTIHHRNVEINILGEEGKWVPVSNQRIVSITVDEDVVVTVKGNPGFQNNFKYAVNFEYRVARFTINNTGFATVTLNSEEPETTSVRIPSTSTTPASSSSTINTFNLILIIFALFLKL